MIETPEDTIAMLQRWHAERYKLEAGQNAAQAWILYGALIGVRAHLDPKCSTSWPLAGALEQAAFAIEHYKDHFPEAARRWQSEIDDLRAKALLAEKNCREVTKKFDDCRGALASLIDRKGGETGSPDDFEGEWHEWLIKESVEL